MLKMLNIETPLDIATLIAVRWNESQTLSFLRSFVYGSEQASARFALDSAGKVAMRNAFCRVADIPRDVHKTVTEVGTTTNGKTTFKPLRKKESAGKRETREVVRHSWSKDAGLEAIEKVRESYGVSWLEDPIVSASTPDTTVYVLVREAQVVNPAV